MGNVTPRGDGSPAAPSRQEPSNPSAGGLFLLSGRSQERSGSGIGGSGGGGENEQRGCQAHASTRDGGNKLGGRAHDRHTCRSCSAIVCPGREGRSPCGTVRGARCIVRGDTVAGRTRSTPWQRGTAKVMGEYLSKECPRHVVLDRPGERADHLWLDLLPRVRRRLWPLERSAPTPRTRHPRALYTDKRCERAALTRLLLLLLYSCSFTCSCS